MLGPAVVALAFWIASRRGGGAAPSRRKRRSRVPSPPEHWREPAPSPFPAKRAHPPGRTHDTSPHRAPVASPQAPRETPRAPKVPLTAPQPAPKPAPKPVPRVEEAAVVTRAIAREHAPLVATQPAPWPAERPTNLSEFPGPEWQADVPLRPEVIARAAQLLRELHAKGLGSHVTENLGGRWIAFVAKMHGTKRAVEAFRRRTDQTSAPRAVNVSTPVVKRPKAPASPAPAESTPRKADVLDPVELETPPPVVVTSPVPVAPAAPAPDTTPPVPSRLPPTLRYGSSGADVSLLQRTLGGIEVDGKFGPKTQAAVRSYQSSHGLQVDGVVGPKTWASLLGPAV